MTLGFFTSPHPDELLYSAFARYSERTSYPNTLYALNDLFGNQKVAAIVDFPNRLERFIAELPSGHNYTSDSLINGHTLFPFYEPFLPPDRARSVRSEMKGEGDNHVRAMLGITAGRIPLPSHLRYCPACVDEDRKKYSETYWHRAHQITGIEVCPTHSGNFLYLWLNKNDSEWLEANLPPARRFIRRGELKDWKSIDVELAAKVGATASRIKETSGRPKWICLSAIIREVGHKGHLEHRLNKLPHTATALDTHLESLEAYTIRKVEWAEGCYRREGHYPTKNKLMKRAGVNNKTGNTLPVQNAVDAALRRLSVRFP